MGVTPKAGFGVQLKAAYDSKDRRALAQLLKVSNELTDDLENLRLAHQKVWLTYNKIFGWEVLDIRYGGTIARMRTVQMRLDTYLNDELTVIEELEEEKLPDPSSKNHGIGRGMYKDIASTSKLSGV